MAATGQVRTPAHTSRAIAKQQLPARVSEQVLAAICSDSVFFAALMHVLADPSSAVLVGGRKYKVIACDGGQNLERLSYGTHFAFEYGESYVRSEDKMTETFIASELSALRSGLLDAGLDSRQIAEAFQIFLAGHGFGTSQESAMEAAIRVSSGGLSAKILREELEQLALVM